jgi:dienelactone hydrolase
MKRIALGIAAGLVLGLIESASAQTPGEMAQTAAFVAAFQNPDGGFPPIAGGASTLGATSSAIRSLRYVGGSIRDVAGCIAFVRACRDSSSGGFAQAPEGKADVSTTAIGLMALAELKAVDDEATRGAIGYFSNNVKSFEDIRIAVAGFEAIEAKSPEFPAWIKQVEADRNPDGTWGLGAGQSRATGSAAVALMRMGVVLDKKDAILATLRSGQRPDGGWSDGEKPSDLGSSYRIMRCFFMLQEKPDLNRLRDFIAGHRQADGGYAPGTSQASDLSSVYMSTIMTRWARLLEGEPPVVETAGFRPLFRKTEDLASQATQVNRLWQFDGRTLVGDSPGLRHNDFLATNTSYANFVLKVTFRLEGDETCNSGIQFRSRRVEGSRPSEETRPVRFGEAPEGQFLEMSGYQADIGQNYWGCLYDESRRNRVLVQASDRAVAAIRRDGWNQYVIRALGEHITLSLNGVTSVDYHEADPNIPQDGQIAFQLHSGKGLKAEFKDIYLQRLPRPTSDATTAQGFHLRVVKTPRGERKYVVYLPNGVGRFADIAMSGPRSRGDGGAPRHPASGGTWGGPVILFLHGAGERGTDGIAPTQVGLGPAILNQLSGFPFLTVFPQAERSWSADSDDAQAALAALEDVLKTYTNDGGRGRLPVILTGLSMGGRGTWEIAAAHPERFVAAVPICGAAKPEVVKLLVEVPVWTFVGDDDRKETVQGMRQLASALREAGAAPMSTEYRGVGHNSWDRAYAEPALWEWLRMQPPRAQ